VLVTALVAAGLHSLPALAAPEGGQVRAGNATIVSSGTQTRVDQRSDRAVIDWRGFSVAANERVLFQQPSSQSATLNRVTGEQLSVVLGRVDANGQVFLINPNGIVFGQGSQLNVGGLVASTAGIGNSDFMAGRLDFRQPGRADAGILNQGHITAAEGGLVALVAPHVRNEGLIQARLGQVVVGAGNTYALDLYGDGLISLGVDPARAGPMFEADGRQVTSLVNQAGRIEADGGRVVLVSAATARNALDQVINLSGSVQADTVLQQGGRIVLMAGGGSAEVSGRLSAQGMQAGQSGGVIDVTGERVHVAAGASVDASGSAGGGAVHLGGRWQGAQGQGQAANSSSTTVDDGSRIAADARQRGNGGEVVVWSDGATAYAGGISARGGAEGGDGGRVEVSGRQTLDFRGSVDAGAVQGAGGLLLLDPEVMTIGAAEAGLIDRVLRTGTSTAVSADRDIFVNATIDGRGRREGGGLTLQAGHDININEFIVTANGAVRLGADTGTVRIAPGRGVFAGNAPITVNTGGDLSAGPYVTSGTLRLTSSAGSVALDTPLDDGIGPVFVNAATDVRINQPVVNLRNGSGFSVTAGGDVFIDAQIDGRGGSAASGAVDLNAGGTVRFNESVVTQLADIRVRAVAGTIATASERGLFAVGGGAIDLAAGGDFTTGFLDTVGTLSLASTSGAVSIGQGIAPTVGNVSIRAATDVNLDTDVLNLRRGSALVVDAVRDIHLLGQIDGRPGSTGGTASGTATLTAGRNIDLQNSITTNEGAISLTATTGTVTQATNSQLRSGAASIGVTSGGDLATGSYVTSGALSLRSTGNAVTVAKPIYDSTGATTITAATDVTVQLGARVENIRTGAALSINAGQDILINGQVGQDRDATTPTGPITLAAGRNVAINQDVVTRDAPLTISAATGTVRVASQLPGQPGVNPQVRAGNGAITVSAGADLYVGDPAAAKPNSETPYITTGALSLSSTTGTLFIEAPIPDSTGRVNLNGGNAVRINERVYSNGQDISITAGLGGIGTTRPTPPSGQPAPRSLSDIDAQTGNLTLLARGDIALPLVRTSGTLSITSTEGQILGGLVETSHAALGVSKGYPQKVLLAGAKGIDGFNTSSSLDVEARSSQGSVTLGVANPQRLYVQAAHDVFTGGQMGSQVELVAGNDVSLSTIPLAGLVRLHAGHNVVLGGASVIGSLSAEAVNDIQVPISAGVTWIEGAGGTMTLRDPANPGPVTLNGLSLVAGQDVTILKPVHVSDSLAITSVEVNLQPTQISAGRNIVVSQLETIGDVSLSAAAGNITVDAPLGGPITVNGFWNPTNLGLHSLNINAPGKDAVISLQGARSEADVTLLARSGTIASAFAITSSKGILTIEAPKKNVLPTPIPLQQTLLHGVQSNPPVSPGPLRAAPDAPLIPGAAAPGAPGLAEVLVSSPSSIDAGAQGAPGSIAAGDVASDLSGNASRATGSTRDAADVGADEGAAGMDRGVLVYSGGRGMAQSADLGRTGNYGSAAAPQAAGEAEKRKRKPATTP
jgi:filamentous hemagglutinin family protein